MVFSGTYSQVIPACFAKDKFKAVLNSGFVLSKVYTQLLVVLFAKFIKDLFQIYSSNHSTV